MVDGHLGRTTEAAPNRAEEADRIVKDIALIQHLANGANNVVVIVPIQRLAINIDAIIIINMTSPVAR